jgi:hypothetical protein
MAAMAETGSGIALQALAEEDDVLAAEEDDLYPWPLRRLLDSKAA